MPHIDFRADSLKTMHAMTQGEAQQWLDALGQYHYPVNLNLFGGRHQFAGDWFAQDLHPAMSASLLELSSGCIVT